MQVAAFGLAAWPLHIEHDTERADHATGLILAQNREVKRTRQKNSIIALRHESQISANVRTVSTTVQVVEWFEPGSLIVHIRFIVLSGEFIEGQLSRIVQRDREGLAAGSQSQTGVKKVTFGGRQTHWGAWRSTALIRVYVLFCRSFERSSPEGYSSYSSDSSLIPRCGTNRTREPSKLPPSKGFQPRPGRPGFKATTTLKADKETQLGYCAWRAWRLLLEQNHKIDSVSIPRRPTVMDLPNIDPAFVFNVSLGFAAADHLGLPRKSQTRGLLPR